MLTVYQSAFISTQTKLHCFTLCLNTRPTLHSTWLKSWDIIGIIENVPFPMFAGLRYWGFIKIVSFFLDRFHTSISDHLTQGTSSWTQMKHASTYYCVCLPPFCLSKPVCPDIVSHIVKNLIHLLIFTATWQHCKVLFTVWAWTDSLFRDSWGTFNATRTGFSKLYLTHINNNVCFCCIVLGMMFFIIRRRLVFVCIHVFVCVCMCLLLCVSVSCWSNGSRGFAFGSESGTTALVQWSDSWVQRGRLERIKFDLISFA